MLGQLKYIFDFQCYLSICLMSKAMYCKFCSLRFVSKSVFKLHSKFSHGQNISGYVNNPTGLKFLVVSLAYQENRTLLCTICKSQFVFHDHLSAHLSSNNCKNVNSYHCEDLKCYICEAGFKQKEYLRKHIDSVHEGKKPFACSCCDAKFVEKRSIKRHFASVHEKEKKKIGFQCNICNKSLTSTQKLKLHIQHVHEGIKQHKCEICKKTFTQKGHMNSVLTYFIRS